ncbi:hypothetical protein SFIMM107S_02512 [Streptomyces griseus]
MPSTTSQLCTATSSDQARTGRGPERTSSLATGAGRQESPPAGIFISAVTHHAPLSSIRASSSSNVGGPAGGVGRAVLRPPTDRRLRSRSWPPLRLFLGRATTSRTALFAWFVSAPIRRYAEGEYSMRSSSVCPHLSCSGGSEARRKASASSAKGASSPAALPASRTAWNGLVPTGRPGTQPILTVIRLPRMVVTRFGFPSSPSSASVTSTTARCSTAFPRPAGAGTIRGTVAMATCPDSVILSTVVPSRNACRARVREGWVSRGSTRVSGMISTPLRSVLTDASSRGRCLPPPVMAAQKFRPSASLRRWCMR